MEKAKPLDLEPMMPLAHTIRLEIISFQSLDLPTLVLSDMRQEGHSQTDLVKRILIEAF